MSVGIRLLNLWNTVFRKYPILFKLSLHLQTFFYKISHIRPIQAGQLANENAHFSPFLIELAEEMNESLVGTQIEGAGSDKEG